MFPAIHRNTRVIVHLNAIKQNIKAVKDHYPNTDIFAVVKANAYGHGLIKQLMKKALRDFVSHY